MKNGEKKRLRAIVLKLNACARERAAEAEAADAQERERRAGRRSERLAPRRRPAGDGPPPRRGFGGDDGPRTRRIR